VEWQVTGEVAFDFGKGFCVVSTAIHSSIDVAVQEQYKRSVSLLLGITVLICTYAGVLTIRS
jgi:hypothetical protein